jgi:DNA-binding transcriptional MerR regulator
MQNELLTSGEVAALVGLSRAHLLYLVERGDVPEPTYVVPGRRLFTANDVESIKRCLRKRTMSRQKENDENVHRMSTTHGGAT